MSNEDLKPIKTSYNGYEFRSRLEARWAVFFDAVKIKYEYEKEGYDLGGELGNYLPDFYIKNMPASTNKGYWVEIKPEWPSQQEMEKLIKLCNITDTFGCLLFGTPGFFRPIQFNENKDVTLFDGYLGIQINNRIDGSTQKSLGYAPRFDNRFVTFQEIIDEGSCKGLIDLYITDIVPKGSPNYVTVCFDYHYKSHTKKLYDAYTKARKAKFEFGESG